MKIIQNVSVHNVKRCFGLRNFTKKITIFVLFKIMIRQLWSSLVIIIFYFASAPAATVGARKEEETKGLLTLRVCHAMTQPLKKTQHWKTTNCEKANNKNSDIWYKTTKTITLAKTGIQANGVTVLPVKPNWKEPALQFSINEYDMNKKLWTKTPHPLKGASLPAKRGGASPLS